MTDKKTFEIYYLKKIPYLTNGLLTLFIISGIIFFFFYAGISSKNATPEMKTFYLTHTSTVKLLYGSALSTVVFSILYLLAKLKKKALLIFNPDSFEILLKKEQMLLPISTMRSVYCNDSEDNDGLPSEKFTMTINMFKNKKILIRLRNTTDIKLFTDKLLSYDGQLKIEYHYSKWAILD
jgi:hypothetical protein